MMKIKGKSLNISSGINAAGTLVAQAETETPFLLEEETLQDS